MRRTARILAIAGIGLMFALAGLAIFVLANRYVPPQELRGAGASEATIQPVADDLSWSAYGGDPGMTRHSAIAQITPANVGRLRLAWTYRTGEVERRGRWGKWGKFQATPILTAVHLVFCTPFGRVIALDPANGQERWVHEPAVSLGPRLPGERFGCRGLALWRSGDLVDAPDAHRPDAGHPDAGRPDVGHSVASRPDAGRPGAGRPDAGRPLCAERLFLATTDRRLVALDARSGTPCPDFGNGGEISVPLERADLGEEELQFTSAPAVIGDVVVVGSASGDNGCVFGPEGAVRAFDARSGTQRWRFDPIPRSEDPVAGPSWHGDSAATTGQANAWGPISVDVERGLVFVPTSSPSPDFYGGLRKGDNLYANSIVALRGSTGERIWHFQTVHHDLWDYDVPSAPSLIDFDGPDGRSRPALVFATKTGFLFVLDRETGEPLTKVEERPVPASDVPGEQASPTQPFSVGQPVLAPQQTSEDDAFGLLGFDRIACRRAIRSASRNEGLFTPPSTGRGTLIVPFSGGGANWGGVAVDPQRRRVFVNTSRAVNRVTLIPADEVAARRKAEPGKEISPMRGAPYGMVRELLLSPIGMPCNKPPWGALAAIDVEHGRLVWEVPLGNTRKLAPFGMAFPFGTPGFGGPIVTAGGVLFIAATMDNLLRAFDARTGEELWAGELPYGGQATPMTYAVGGRQYVVVAAGGHPSLGNEIGDALLAFALP